MLEWNRSFASYKHRDLDTYTDQLVARLDTFYSTSSSSNISMQDGDV
jgi:hypothetical protein